MGTAGRVSFLLSAALAVALGIVGLTALTAQASTISLVIPQGTAFLSYLGHSCGGIQEKAYASGFDPTSGFPTGDVYMSTSCSGSGRGAHSTTYTAWATATWDFTGALVSSSALSSAPATNPTFSAFDSYGNEVSNLSGNAYLTLSPTFVPVPRLTLMQPTMGPASGGTAVSITGTGFTGATAVDFGTTHATSYSVVNDTSITAVAPPGAGTVTVTVTTPGGSDVPDSVDQFTFVPAPTISGLSPNTGPVSGATAVTITGANLTGVSTVSFGGTPTGFKVNGPTSIAATAPVGEAVDTVEVTVTSIGGLSTTSSATTYTYTAAATGTPGAPTIGAATAGDGSASVSFAAPATDGGSPVTSYRVTAVDGTDPANGGQSGTGTGSPVTVVGLTNTESYTFTVTATNVNGVGPASGPSNAVAPMASGPPLFHIETTSLPPAVLGIPYHVGLAATGGTGPYRWRATSVLPRGFRVHLNGLLLGKPSVTWTGRGMYVITVQATAKGTRRIPGQNTTQVLTLTIF